MAAPCHAGGDRFARWPHAASSPGATWHGSASSTASAAQTLLADLGEVTRPLVPLIARTADPDLALASLVALADAAEDREALLEEVADDEGTSMRLLSVLGMPARRSATTCAGTRDHWHELTDPTPGVDPALGVRRPGRADARGRRRSRRRARRVVAARTARPWTRCGWSTAGCCSGWRRATSRTTSAWTTPPPSSPTSPPAPSTPRSRSRGPRWVTRPAACRLAVIAMGKCGGHELNYVSDVDVIFVAEPADGRRRAACPAGRDPARLDADAGLLRPHRARARSGRSTRTCAPRASPGRWSARSPATAATTSAGRRPGSSRRCSRRARWPATSRSGREYVEVIEPDGLVGRRARRASSRTSSRCAAG